MSIPFYVKINILDLCLPFSQQTEEGGGGEGEVPGGDDPEAGGGEEGGPQSAGLSRPAGWSVGDTQS